MECAAQLSVSSYLLPLLQQLDVCDRLLQALQLLSARCLFSSQPAQQLLYRGHCGSGPREPGLQLHHLGIAGCAAAAGAKGARG